MRDHWMNLESMMQEMWDIYLEIILQGKYAYLSFQTIQSIKLTKTLLGDPHPHNNLLAKI
jgi:hypothetical protein